MPAELIGEGRRYSLRPLADTHALGWDSDGNVHARALPGRPAESGPREEKPPQGGRRGPQPPPRCPGSVCAHRGPADITGPSMRLHAENHDLLQRPGRRTAAGRYRGELAGRAASTPRRPPGSALCWPRWRRADGSGASGLLFGRILGNGPWLADTLRYIPEILFPCLPW